MSEEMNEWTFFISRLSEFCYFYALILLFWNGKYFPKYWSHFKFPFILSIKSISISFWLTVIWGGQQIILILLQCQPRDGWTQDSRVLILYVTNFTIALTDVFMWRGHPLTSERHWPADILLKAQDTLVNHKEERLWILRKCAS